MAPSSIQSDCSYVSDGVRIVRQCFSSLPFLARHSHYFPALASAGPLFRRQLSLPVPTMSLTESKRPSTRFSGGTQEE